MKKSNTPITRLDLEVFGKELKKDIVDEISAVLADVMNAVGFQFQIQQNNFEELKVRVKNIEESQARMEQKLDPTIDRVDDHSIRIKKLETKAGLA